MLLIIIALIVLSGLFTAADSAIGAVSKVKLNSAENEGNVAARKLNKLLEKEGIFSVSLLVCDVIVNFSAVALSIALFCSLLEGWLGYFVGAAAIAVALLLFGEVAPKTFAAQNPEKTATGLYGLVFFCYWALIPITVVFYGWKILIAKTFKVQKAAVVTEDELINIVEAAEEEGEIEKHESELIRSAIEFEDRDVKDVMIPRVNVVAISNAEKPDEIYKTFTESGFSRLPVYEQSIDSIVGIVHEKDFFALYHQKCEDYESVIQKCIYVSPSLKISAVLSMLQKAKVHMAIVVDEFGGTEGIVTLEDIIEELVGEIYDEHDEEEETLTEVEDNTYVVQGAENFSELLEKLDVVISEETEATTVGGFVTEQLDRIPVPGDSVTVGRLTLEVIDANERAAREVKITVSPLENKEEE